MDEYGRRRVFEVIQNDFTPPGHFQEVLCRKGGWLGVFCYDFEEPRWNRLIPVPGEDVKEVPEEFLDLAEDISDRHSIYGEKSFVEETVELLGLENVENDFEMTYLVPDDLPSQEDLPEVDYRRTDSEEVIDDFVEIFRKAFGEKQDDGSYSISDAMHEGLLRVIRDEDIGVDRTSFVGYIDGEPVSTGTLSFSEGDGFLFNVASHPDRRGEGLGTGITRRLVNLADEKGLDEVFIGTEPNTDVEKFYRSIGCREVFTTKSVEIELGELR